MFIDRLTGIKVKRQLCEKIAAAYRQKVADREGDVRSQEDKEFLDGLVGDTNLQPEQRASAGTLRALSQISVIKDTSRYETAAKKFEELRDTWQLYWTGRAYLKNHLEKLQ